MRIRAGGIDMDRKPRNWLLQYTLWYALIALGASLIFFFGGKSLVWGADAPAQAYGTLAYLSEHVRALFATGRFGMVDLSLGQGADVLTSLGLYGLTDPLNLLAALATGDGLETAYAALICLRLWLAGAAFGLFARYALKGGGWATAGTWGSGPWARAG